MKKIIILLTVSLLMSCTPSHNDAKNKFNLPAELSDCTVISLLSSDAQNYTVFRCPLSNTTTVSHEKSKKNNYGLSYGFYLHGTGASNDNGESFGGERSGGKKNVYSDIPCGKCCKF